MKIKQKVLILTLLLGLSGVFLIAPAVSAATCGGVTTSVISCGNGELGSCADGSIPVNAQCSGGLCSKKTDVPVNGICPKGEKWTAPKLDKDGNYPKYTPPNDLTKSGIWSLLLMTINILTVGVGVAAVGGIIASSVIYMTAGGSPDRVKKANMYLTNTILGVIVYAAMYAFLNFLIPGGLFS